MIIDADLETLERYRQLLARKEQLTRDAMSRYLHDPAAWVRDRLGLFFWSKQVEIALSVVANGHTAVKSCHGAGKSFTAACLTLWWVDVHPPGTAIVVTTAPSYEQVHSVLWEEIRRLHVVGNMDGEAQRSDKWLDEQGRQVAFGRRPPDHQESAFQGIHKEFVLVILDEAGGIPAWLWTAAEAITTGSECRILAIGNPDDNSSEFARVCTQDVGWHTIHISAFDTPNLTGEIVPDAVRKVVISKEWVEDKLKRWGATNPLYLAKVLGEFADSEDGLVPLSWIKAAQKRWHHWEELLQKPPQPGRLIVACDVARYGEDKTAISLRHGDHYRPVRLSSKEDTVQTTSRVMAAMHGIPGAVSIVDVIGVGAGVVDQLRQRGLPVIAFNASAKTTRRDVTNSWGFPNVRSAAMWNVRELLDPANDPSMMLPPDDDLAAELAIPKWKVAPGAKLVVESKDEIRKRIGRSTDSADSVMMAAWVEKTPLLDELGRPLMPKVHRHADAVEW